MKKKCVLDTIKEKNDAKKNLPSLRWVKKLGPPCRCVKILGPPVDM